MIRPCPDCGIELEQHAHGRARRCTVCHKIARKAIRDKFRSKPYGKFVDQRNAAKQRGIEFLFTFEQWLEWWGLDLVNRGTKRDELCMARLGDIGPYHPDNCIKLTNFENQNLRAA